MFWRAEALKRHPVRFIEPLHPRRYADSPGRRRDRGMIARSGRRGSTERLTPVDTKVLVPLADSFGRALPPTTDARVGFCGQPGSVRDLGATLTEAALMKKQRQHTRRGGHYRALAQGYAALNSPVADSFRRAADHFDDNDPPLDLVADADKERKEGGKDDD